MFSSKGVSHTEQLKAERVQAALKDFVVRVRKMREEKAELYLVGVAEELREEILGPRVFFSYAWEQGVVLERQQSFWGEWKMLFEEAGLKVWFDMANMIGSLEQKMREGIEQSDAVILMGTQRYASRIAEKNKTNVAKELDYAMEQHAAGKLLLLPLLFEGDFNVTFPEAIRSNLILPVQNWINFQTGAKDVLAYAQALTSAQPVGVLAALLGIDKSGGEHARFREACQQSYTAMAEDFHRKLREIEQSLAKHDSACSVVPQTQPLGSSALRSMESKGEVDISVLRQRLAGVRGAQEALFAEISGKNAVIQNEEALVAYIKELKYKVAEAEEDEEEALYQKRVASAKEQLAKLKALKAEEAALAKELEVLREEFPGMRVQVSGVSARGAKINVKGKGNISHIAVDAPKDKNRENMDLEVKDIDVSDAEIVFGGDFNLGGIHIA